MTFALLLLALLTAASPQAAPATPHDPHNGSFTTDLGVDCAHCHEPGVWKTSSLPAFDMAARMEKMTNGVSNGSLSYAGGISCNTCHAGHPDPPTLQESAWKSLYDEWPDSAAVSPANAEKPAREVYKNLRALGDIKAGDMRMTMSVFAAALGVGCVHCHTPDEWDSENKPAKKTALSMLKLMDEMPTYFQGMAKPPQFQCYTCHQGVLTPTQ
ncbi:MAG: photosynthetic reaction center cytochrome c subunit family protein [Betaproteobacteria bacterium]